MSSIFERVKESMHPRLDAVLPELLPGGKISGREYVCGSLQGGPGDSCKTNLDSGKGSDFATGDAALALWRYAQESALYIFGDRAADPLEEKILEALKQGPLTATELSAIFCRNISKERLQPVLQQLEAQQRIAVTKVKGAGRPKLIISMREISIINEKSENNEFDEKRRPYADRYFGSFVFFFLREQRSSAMRVT